MKAVTLDQSLLKDTKSGESNHSQPHLNWWGLYSPITLKQMYANYQQNLLDKCSQRLLCCDQRIEELTRELKEWKAKKVEALKLQKAIKEVK